MKIDESFEIVRTSDGFYRYVNHDLEMLTLGFIYEGHLIDHNSVFNIKSAPEQDRMKERYQQHFNTNKP